MISENHYRIAHENGRIGERLLEEMLKCSVDSTSLIDVLNGLDAPVEIKTCTDWVKCSNRPKARRRGRYVLMPSQHKALLDTGGYYVFCLLNQNREVYRIKAISAKNFFYPDLFSQSRKTVTLTWKNVFLE